MEGNDSREWLFLGIGECLQLGKPVSQELPVPAVSSLARTLGLPVYQPFYRASPAQAL